MMEDFLLRAAAGGLGLAAAAGPLGCFVIWRRMAYFGDALAHGALLGVALGLALRVGPTPATLGAFVVFAALLTWLESRPTLATDTLLGILSHGALALGLVALSFLERVRVDLLGYLFGDILSVTWTDLMWIYGGGAVVLAVLAWLWPRLLLMAVHEELAQAEGVAAGRMRLALMLLMALVILMGIKIAGVLLITALLIIPPATARAFARSPEQMAVLAALLGALAVVAGLLASLRWDTPSGPSMVMAAVALFAIAQAWSRLREAAGGRAA